MVSSQKISSPKKLAAPMTVMSYSSGVYHAWVTFFLFIVVIVCVLCGQQGGLVPTRKVKDMDVSGDLTVEGTLFGDTTPAYSVVTAATLAAQPGNEYVLNRAAAQAVTVPLPNKGDVIRFSIGITATGNKTITVASGSLLEGYAYLFDTAEATANTRSYFPPDVTNDRIITMNGGTTGGLIGGTIELVGVSSTRWRVRANLPASGTAASPFS